MAETPITVTSSTRYAAGEDPTATAGDAANDHTLQIVGYPMCLVCVNSNEADVDFQFDLPASKNTWNLVRTISHTIPGADGGANGVRVVWIDTPDSITDDGVLNISSTDVNFGDVRFYAIAGTRTPR